MLRVILAGVGVSTALVMLGGCPPEAPPDSGELADMTPQTEAPESAVNGEMVSLIARLAGAADPGSITFRWFQTYGRLVELTDPDSAEASFVAPSLAKDQTLRFRVDVQGADGTIYSATAEVIVAADPNYGLEQGADPGGSGDEDPSPQVRLITNKGAIVLELDRVNAPLTVNNFLRYVNDGFYDGTIFHRVIPDFVVQGGGYEPDLVEKEARPPIRNESDNGLKNDRGTLAMARKPGPDTATAQFYINLEDNDELNATPTDLGYTVFGRVIRGMDVVDKIAEVETESRDGFDDVPVDDIVLQRAERISDGGVPGTGGDGGGDEGDGGSKGGSISPSG